MNPNEIKRLSDSELEEEILVWRQHVREANETLNLLIEESASRAAEDKIFYTPWGIVFGR